MITCAIQLGSSRILAIAGNRDVRTGRFSNIQIESEEARNCISHGCIINVEQAAMHIRSLIQKLSNRMRATISSAYVGVGGMSLHSIIQLPSVQIPDYDVLASESIDHDQYQLTIGSKVIRQQTLAAMARANVNVVEIIALPEATSTILTAAERQGGCLLVDMGAGTTTVAIFKDNGLRHLAVIPLGGDSVTYDIMTEGISFEEAERIKEEWSNVSSDSAASSQFADKALPFPQSKLNKIALCRYEEIALNIEHQLEIAGMKDQLEAGCILTGGAAMQSGLTTLLRHNLSVSRIATRAYNEPSMLGSERKPHLANALGLLSLCDKDCQAVVKPVEPVEPKPARAAAQSAETPANPLEPTLDLPDDDEPEEAAKSNTDTRSLFNLVRRIGKDIFTGQNN